MEEIKLVTEAGFAADVLQPQVPVLVDFWATWCGPCRRLVPVLEEIAAEYAGRLRVTKVDIEADPSIASTYQVMAVPTMLLFSQGAVVRTISGYRPKAAIVQEIAPFVS